MPTRATAAFASSRRLRCRAIPQAGTWGIRNSRAAPARYQIERKWGIFNPTLDPTREETYTFLDGLIGEIAALFPDEYFHVGGDEVNGKQWDANPQIGLSRQAHGMKDNADLQLYFNRHLLPIVQKHGKKMIGWDEIFHPDLPKDIVVHSWRGPESLAQTARLGYMSILSNGYYLDFALRARRVLPSRSPGRRRREPYARAGRAHPGRRGLHVERVTSRRKTSTRASGPPPPPLPRGSGLPQDVKDVDSMYRRLEVVSRELDWVGVTHHSSYPLMLARLAGMHSPETLETLADVVEPVKHYEREAGARIHQFDALQSPG